MNLFSTLGGDAIFRIDLLSSLLACLLLTLADLNISFLTCNVK